MNVYYVKSLLELASAIFNEIFIFFTKWQPFKNYEKCFFISSKKLISFLRYSSFCNFFPSYSNFPDSKGQMEVE